MATIRSSAGDAPLKINHEGKVHELIITPRGGIDPEKLKQVIVKTIITWRKAYTAITNATYELPEGSVSACEVCNVEPHPIEPHCTVWNKTYNGASLTVHSNDNGQAAVDAYGALVSATDWLRSNAPYLFENVPAQQTPQASPTVSNTPPQVLNAFVRGMKSVGDSVMIEAGKTDSPSWKDAMLAIDVYNSAKNYKPGTLVLYRLDIDDVRGNVEVREYDGKGILSFSQWESNDDIAIWYGEDKQWQDKMITSDWNKALAKLGLTSVEPGQSFVLHADYIVMKAGKVNAEGKQYKNFYGFVNGVAQLALEEGLAKQSTVIYEEPHLLDIPF